MRGNSGYQRSIAHTWLLAAAVLVLCTLTTLEAGPTRIRRQLVTSIDIAALADSSHAEAEETCMLNGKEELRSSVQCLPKTGCRKIEIRDECCPLYKCDCQFNGRTYENNEKISDPSTPCHVCLCRGGEIKCTSVTCYNRNDCGNTTFVEGVCCPQYDNCPPIEDYNPGAAPSSTPEPTIIRTGATKEQLLATPSPIPTIITSSQQPPAVLQPLHDNPLGIKIKEITKPEEIRITDDKPKLYKPPARTTATTTETPTSTTVANTVLHISSSSSDIIITEDAVASGDAEDEILPEDASDDATSIDDLSQFETGDDRFTESSGIKSIRQTEPIGDDLSADASSVAPEVHISDKLIDLSTISSSTSTEGSGSDVVSIGWSSTVSSSEESDLAVSSESPRPETNSQLIYFKGQPITVIGVDGLTRGNDDEDEPKTGRRAAIAANGQNVITTMVPPVQIVEDPSATSTLMPLIMSGEASGSSEVFEAVYYEPATEAPTDLSSEIFEHLAKVTTRPLTSDEVISIYEQQQHILAHPGRETSEEFIGVSMGIGAGMDGSGSADGSGALSSEESDMEGSSPVGDAVVSTVATVSASPPIEDASTSGPLQSITTETPAAVTSSEQTPPSTANETTTADDDKTREFPEQSDDYSLHSRMQNEDHHGKTATIRELAAIAAESESEDALRVIPIEGRQELATSESPEVEHSSYSDVQERSPGEPFLVPEWERNTTTESSVPAPSVRINRNDSLILLPVDDDANFGRMTPSVASSSVATVEEDSVATTTTEHSTLNEVTGSAEGRSVDEGFADQLFGNNKLKYYFRVPGEFIRYQDKFMNS